jgi:hypothetical protein
MMHFLAICRAMPSSTPNPSSPSPLPIVVPNSLLQVAQQTGDLMAIVGFDVTLSQSEVPYAIVPGVPIAASETDLVVYGDTVTITSDLVNPGRQIAIYARQIVCGQLTFISTAGAAPVSDYQPGDPAQQTDNNSGAAGAGGAAGSPGLTAGSIILAAESIQVQGPDTGAGTPGRALCIGQLLPQVDAAVATAVSSLSQGFCTTPITVSNQPIASLPGWSLTGISFTCSGTVSVTGCQWTGSAFQVIVQLEGAQFQSQISGSIYNVPISVAANGSFGLSLTLSVVPAIGGLAPGGAPVWGVGGVAVSVSNTGIPSLDADIDGFIDSLVTGVIQGSIAGGSLNAVSTSLAAAIAAGIFPTGSNPALVLSANGGRGGRGQDGNAGIIGATGAPGQAGLSGPMQPPYYPSGAEGGVGGLGGQGGNAGASGAGGQGGTITVNTVKTSSPAVLALAAGGAGGAPSATGSPGSGGPGGQGATWQQELLSMAPRTFGAPDGPTGPGGPAAAVQGAVGAAGPAGTSSLDGVGGQASSYTYAQLANQLDLYQLIFTQQGAKVAYLNARSATDYQNVGTLYTWLSNATTPFAGGAVPPGCTFSSTDVATRAAIYTSAAQELARLATGLDYYGEALNWVGVLTWTALNTFITQQLASMEAIQNELTQGRQITQQVTSAQAAIASAQQDLANLQAYETTVQSQINALSDQITALDTSVADEVVVVQQALLAVETELLAETGCPSISSLLTTLGSIVSLGKDVMAAKSDIAAGLKVPGDAASVYQNVKNLVVQIETPEVNCSSIATAWNNLQTTLQTNGANSALILADADKFTALVQKLCSGLNGTQTLINSINTLVGLVQTRNQTVLNYSGQYMNLARLQTRSTQKSAELEHIAAVIAEGQQPQLPVYLAFLQSTLTEMGNTIVGSLYQANQAFNYGMVQAQPFSVKGLDLASLSAAASTLQTAVTDALICQGGAFQIFNNITYTATAADAVDAFAAFAATGVLFVQVPIDAAIAGFTGNYNITVANIAVSLTGVTPPAGTAASPTVLDVDILQLGPDLKQAQGSTTVVAFTHAPRPLEYAWNYTTGMEMIDGTVGDQTQGFAGLSPFATWKFDFTPSAAWLTAALRGQVTGVELTFSGQLLPPSAAR